MLNCQITLIVLGHLFASINSKLLLISSLFRHGERLSYINFSENRRNSNILTTQGQLSAFQSGNAFYNSFKVKDNNNNKPLQKEDIICYEGDRPRTIQSLSFRLGGMLNLPIDLLLKHESYHDLNNEYCNLRNTDSYLFPQKKCKLLFNNVNSSNKQFKHYIENSILHSIHSEGLLMKYLKSDIYYKDNAQESIYDKLNLISDYLILNGNDNKSLLTKEEREIRNAFDSYQYNYFNSLIQNDEVIEAMVAKYYQLLIAEMDNMIQVNCNKIKYMLFSNHEFSIASIIQSLNIINEDRPNSIAFNDELNIVLIKKDNELFIVVYYNNQMIKMSHCGIYCPYVDFKNGIIKKYLGIDDSQIDSICKQTKYKIDEL